MLCDRISTLFSSATSDVEGSECREVFSQWLQETVGTLGDEGRESLIITAERAAQTTASHSHHEGCNTLHLTLNLFAASRATYTAFWLQSLSGHSPRTHKYMLF